MSTLNLRQPGSGPDPERHVDTIVASHGCRAANRPRSGVRVPRPQSRTPRSPHPGWRLACRKVGVLDPGASSIRALDPGSGLSRFPVEAPILEGLHVGNSFAVAARISADWHGDCVLLGLWVASVCQNVPVPPGHGAKRLRSS